MSEKSWLLSAAAMKVAKECIKTVELELGVRLSLTHPEFLQMLNDYAEMCDSEQLTRHVQALNKFAKGLAAQQAKGSVVALNSGGGREVETASIVSRTQAPAAVQRRAAPEAELVHYQGKTYQRFYDGKEFKGLYRGQPKYG